MWAALWAYSRNREKYGGWEGTLLSGLLPDQAALHGLLVRDPNLTLISVSCRIHLPSIRIRNKVKRYLAPMV
jgi:hypothetical protein